MTITETHRRDMHTAVHDLSQRQPIDLVICDLGGVLYDIDFQRTIEAMTLLDGYNGQPITFGVNNQDELFVAIDRGDISEEMFVTELRKKFGFLASSSDIIKAWCAILLGPFPETPSIVDSLVQYHRTVLLSNISEPHLAVAEPECRDFLSRMSATYFSCRLRQRKPDASAFLAVTSAEGIDPQSTVLLDDSRANILAAVDLGIHCIWIRNDD